ncbi:hypothetical protein [Brachybacterium sacelli]|uniref:hypothetical protein n=1 Tax=Brachybacterium sacelli TaxID=173364 RepID=UPI003610EF98
MSTSEPQRRPRTTAHRVHGRRRAPRSQRTGNWRHDVYIAVIGAAAASGFELLSEVAMRLLGLE